jgi:hypothetical protein
MSTISDVVSVLGVFGGIVLFGRALYEWRDAQQWKRADKLEGFIKEFETEPLLVFGRSVIDWTRRTVDYRERKSVTISNTDALLALRIHTELKVDPTEAENDREYTGEQPLIRDALDTLLNFFDRLAVAVSTELVDADHARVFFRYWLWKLVTYNAHPVEKEDKQTRHAAKGTPEERMARYIAEYGNIELVVALCRLFGVKAPQALVQAESAAQDTHWVEPVVSADRAWL